MLILYTIQRKHYFEPWLISKHCTYVDHFESVVNLPYKSEIWFCRRGKFVGVLQSNQVKRTPQEAINEFIIQKLNPLLVVDFRLISAFLYV